MLCAVMTAWGETTYKLVQVTSVEAGKLYVFEQKGYVMINSISSTYNSLQCTSTYNTKGLTGTERYVWTLTSGKGGYYMKNVDASKYLWWTGHSTDLSLETTSSGSNGCSLWKFTIQDDKTFLIQETQDNRFLGYTSTTSHSYKAYASGTIISSNYPHAIKVYQLVEETSVTLNSSGFATYASTHPLDFSNASDYTAWQITGVSGNVINFQQITGAVAAGTGVFLKGTAGESVEIPFASTGDKLNTNKLVGITTATEIASGDYYGLSGSNFVKVNAGIVPAGKALLPASVVGEGTQGGHVKALMFVFDHIDGVRSIETVSAEAAAEVFNLAGQRISSRQPGINIINGKKVLVK